jgi:Zn-finger nucleic acid-binding protein
MNCPRCNVPLEPHQASRVLLHGCAQCGGLWLDGEASRRVVEAIDPTVMTAADAESRRARALQVDVTRVAPCPVCAQPLKRMPIDQAHVDVDACEQHGVWFDRDELQRVISAVAPPPAQNAQPMQPPATQAAQPMPPAASPTAQPMQQPAAPAPGGGFPAAAFFSPTNEAPAPLQQPGSAGSAGTNVNAMPAAAFFTDTGGGSPQAPGVPGVPGAPGAPQAGGGGWGLGKTALVVGGGVAAVAGVGYLATHTDVGRRVISGATGPGPSLSDVGSVISRLF